MHDILMPYVERGLLTRREHPEYPYSIYNYTEACAFGHEWDDVTRKARGLILDADGKIVARGMDKFFNYGEQDADYIDLMDHVRVCDKMDGSLGIIYRTPDDGWAVATRGSFTSEQAIHATALLNSSPEALWFAQNQRAGHNLVVEIVYPENRIVLDYGDRDELILLGAVEHESGRFIPMWHDQFGLWPWSVAQGFGEMTYADALALPDRENAEGIVLTRVNDGAMVKMKQEDYLEMARVVSNLNPLALWRLGPEDQTEFISALPDEFQDWAREMRGELEAHFQRVMVTIEREYIQVIGYLNHQYGEEGWGRPEFAEEAKKQDFTWAHFMLFDGKDLDEKAWALTRPKMQ